MKDVINNRKKFSTWKFHLTMVINGMSSKDTHEERLMHLKSDNIEIMTNDKIDESIEKAFQLLLSRYQIGSETTVKGSRVFFDHIHLLYYKCYKINPNLGGSYINYPDKIRKKKATTNPINKNYNKCFQYSVTLA